MRKLILILFLVFFTLNGLSQDYLYNRDTIDHDYNGIRDDVDLVIERISDTPEIKSKLTQYAYFLSKFTLENGYKKAQSFAYMMNSQYCIGNKNSNKVNNIKAIVLDSEEMYRTYLEAEKKISNSPWIISAVDLSECNFTEITSTDVFEKLVDAKWQKNICENIVLNTVVDRDPIAREHYLECEKARSYAVP